MTESCQHNLAKKTQHFLNEHLDFSLPKISSIQESIDGTVKFLIELQDGHKVEMVLLPFQEKYTLCLSSQVGCAMNCSFCFTATAGFTRNLLVEEIVGQFVLAKTWLQHHRQAKLVNLVFMGQGEPLLNFDNVAQSIVILLDQHGTSLAPHKITVSTAGYLPGILRIKEEMPPVNIALSLHSPFNQQRSELIPLNMKYPLEALLPYLEEIPQGKNRFITYEYLLLKNINDSTEHAHAVGKLLQGKKAYLNLINFNPYPGCLYQACDDQMREQFKKICESYQIPTTLRSPKGQDILAACGQLKNTH